MACYPGLWNPALTARGPAAVELWIQFHCGTCRPYPFAVVQGVEISSQPPWRRWIWNSR